MDNYQLLHELQNRVTKRFGAIIDRIILFGSRVTGQAREYSDYDLLFILKTNYDWTLENEIRDVCYDICIENDILLDLKIISNNELHSIKGKQPFIQDAIETGISL